MKKVLLSILSVLVVSAVFASEPVEKLMDNVSTLEAQFEGLMAQDEAAYLEERAKAETAMEELTQQKAMYAQLNSRIGSVKKMKGDQYKELAGRYEDALKELQSQIKENEKIVSDFAKLEARRNPVVKETKQTTKKTTKKTTKRK